MLSQTQKNSKRPRVFVAMSGGVDSSVAAALLKQAGFEVVGIFMRLWKTRTDADLKNAEERGRTRKNAEESARAVAKRLGIKLYILNLEEIFKKKIVDYFISEYGRCRTPNPCVVCNREIKFGALLKMVRQLGGDYLATGHYIIKTQEQATLKLSNIKTRSDGFYPLLTKEGRRGGFNRLLAAKDRNKDQSYFLYNLTQKELSHILFPIGDYTKTEVRKLARKFKLPTAEKAESQEVCFVADNNHNKFLKKYLKLKPGKIVDVKNKILGRHEGLALYTLGQRKGIGLAGGPYYVISFNQKKNQLVVSNNLKDAKLFSRELTAGDLSWVAGAPPKMPFKCMARIRYQADLTPAVVSKKGKDILVRFSQPQRAIMPGQSVVFYGDADRRGQARTNAEGRGRTRTGAEVELLGGGVIK